MSGNVQHFYSFILSYQSPHTWYEANPPQCLIPKPSHCPICSMQEQTGMSHHMTKVYRQVVGDPIQRRSDVVDLCEIKYLGSLLIDFE